MNKTSCIIAVILLFAIYLINLTTVDNVKKVAYRGNATAMSTEDAGTAAAAASKKDQFDTGYKKYKCLQCPEVSTLIDPNAPRAIIAGAMKGGTRALLEYLGEHPDVYTHQGSEVHLFSKGLKHSGRLWNEESIDRCEVLRMYHDIFKEKGKKRKEIFFDKSPNYVVRSHEVPQRILCTFPDVKVILLLRNPIDRAYSHYYHCVKKFKHTNKMTVTFEEAIDMQIDDLSRFGILNASSPTNEYKAWENYAHSSKMEPKSMMSRSLYAIQLRQWIAVFRDFYGAENVKDHLLILESEEMHVDKQGTYNRVLDFVGLPRYTLYDTTNKHVDKYEPMANETRKRLQEFFRPHNQKLHELLSPLGIEISWAKDALEY